MVAGVSTVFCHVFSQTDPDILYFKENEKFPHSYLYNDLTNLPVTSQNQLMDNNILQAINFPFNATHHLAACKTISQE